jgi:hypothetical protein
MDLVEGQKLVYVPHDTRRAQPHEVTVERVGRKWAYLAGNQGRIDDALVVDGGNYSSPGRCYGSWQEYEETTELAKAWNEFWRAIQNRHKCPDGVTVEKISRARAILNI